MWSVLSAGHQGASASDSALTASAVNTSHTLAQLREAAEDVRAAEARNPPELLCGMYRVGALIRHGATGTVHHGDVLAAAWARGAPSADDDETGPRVDLVLKLEEESARKQQMVNEWRVYEALRQRQTDGSTDPNSSHKAFSGFPVARFGRHEPSPSTSLPTPQACALHVLAMEALGPDLGALLASRQQGAAASHPSSSSASSQSNGFTSPPTPPPRRMSLKTVLSLGEQMVGLLERLHAAGFCHRDLKPENFVVGRGPAANKLFLLDFGVACPLVTPQPGESNSNDNGSSTGEAAPSSSNDENKINGNNSSSSSSSSKDSTKGGEIASEHEDAAVADFLSTYAGKAQLDNSSAILSSSNITHQSVEASAVQAESTSDGPVRTKSANLVGSVRYLSEQAHGYEGAPVRSYGKTAADDLESAGFVLAYLFRGGRLPWQGLLPPSAPLAVRNEAVRVAKRDCASNGWASLECPAIAEYLTLVRSMANASSSSGMDYRALQNVFTSWRKRRGIRDDGELEWTSSSSSSQAHLQQAHITATPAPALSADSSGSGSAGSDSHLDKDGDGGLLSLYAEMPKAFELSMSGLPPALPPPSSSTPPFAPPLPSLQPVKSALKRKRNAADDDDATDAAAPENSKNAYISGDAVPDMAAAAAAAPEDDNGGARLVAAKRARRVHWPCINNSIAGGHSSISTHAGGASQAPALAPASEVSACFELQGLGPPSDAALIVALNGPHAASAASAQTSDAAASVAEDALLSRWKAALTKSSSSSAATPDHASSNLTPSEHAPNGGNSASETSGGGNSSSKSGNSGVDPVAALVKIVPHLRSDKKAAKALSLLAALLRAHVPPADARLGEANQPTFENHHSQGLNHKALALEFHGALAIAVSESRRVHDPSLRLQYAALLTAAFGSAPGSGGSGSSSSSSSGGGGNDHGARRAMSYFWPSPLRADVALWCIAGWVFNATCAPPPTSSSSGSNSSQRPQAQESSSSPSETYPVLVPVLAACVNVILEGTSATAATAVAAAPGSPSSVSSSTIELYKVRLVDVLQRLHDRFREPWTTLSYRDQCIAVFEGVLALPGSWWPPPNGKAKRNQVERWASSMSARR